MISALAVHAQSEVITSCVAPNQVALTLDDGPSIHTEDYLVALGTQNINATFFVLGQQLEAFPDVLQKIVDSGHSVAHHSYDHPVFTTLTEEQIGEQVVKTNNLIEAQIGKSVKFFRPPQGEVDDNVITILSSYNLTVVNWDVDSNDWKVAYSPEQEAILAEGNTTPISNEESVKLATDGALDTSTGHILLGHDIHTVILDNLEVIVKTYQDAGFTFVKLHECLGVASDYHEIVEADIPDVPVPQSEPVYQEISAFDYPYSDVGYKEEVTKSECLSACSMEPSCIGVSLYAPEGLLNDDQKTLCWLKNAFTNGVPHAERKIFYKEDSSAIIAGFSSIDTATFKDSPHNDIGEKREIPFGACSTECINTKDTCGGYVLDIGMGTGCWIKDKTFVNAAIEDNEWRYSVRYI